MKGEKNETWGESKKGLERLRRAEGELAERSEKKQRRRREGRMNRG